MKTNNFTEEEFSHITHIGSLFAREKVSHFGVAVNNYKYGINLSLSLWQAEYNIHTKVLPNIVGDEQWNV